MQGTVANLQKRNRAYPLQLAALRNIPLPKIYIYSVGAEPWKGVGGGKEYKINACPKGQRYSEPIEIPMLCLSEVDLADGGNNMGVVQDTALSGTLEVNGEGVFRSGVADDIIGINSGSADLSFYTTSGKWRGAFYSQSNPPLEEEVLAAEEALRQYNLLVYAEGAQRVEQKMAENKDPVLRMKERQNFNRAAVALGYKPLYGEGEMRLGTCPECHEQIMEGANYCKHCQQAIDPATVSARAKKRQKEAAKLMKDDEQEVGE
jgi:hypothetical protein